MIPVMYCGNDKVFDGMLISLLSATKYCKEPLDVFILTMDLQDLNKNYTPVREEHRAFLEETIKKVNPESRVRLYDLSKPFMDEMKDCPSLQTNYGPYTFARLFADYIEEIPSLILYMDTDTICHGNIAEAFKTDMSNYEFAAAIDYLGKFFLHYDYQNAGVLLLNMALIKQNKFFDRVREYCRTHKMFFPDQTALNRVVKNKKFLSTRFNEQRLLHKNTVIQHFSKSIRLWPFYHTVNIKPWQIDKMHSVYKIHAYDDILEEYVKLKKVFEEK